MEIWEALERFCQKRLGVEAGTLFCAWGLPIHADLVEVRRQCAHLNPDEAKVAECVGYLELAWVERFGTE